MKDALMVEDVPRRITPGRVPVEEAKRRRKLLLDTALEEFVEHGFAAANLDHIAKRCRIGKMTIYRQIGSKHDLFRLATEQASLSLKARCQAIVDSGGTIEQVVRAFVELCRVSSQQSNFAMLQLAISERRSFPELAAKMLLNVEDIYTPLASYFQTIHGGSLSFEQARREVLILMNMAIGGFLKLIGSREPDDAAWSSDVCRIFMDGVGLGQAQQNVSDSANLLSAKLPS